MDAGPVLDCQFAEVVHAVGDELTALGFRVWQLFILLAWALTMWGWRKATVPLISFGKKA